MFRTDRYQRIRMIDRNSSLRLCRETLLSASEQRPNFSIVQLLHKTLFHYKSGKNLSEISMFPNSTWGTFDRFIYVKFAADTFQEIYRVFSLYANNKL